MRILDLAYEELYLLGKLYGSSLWVIENFRVTEMDTFVPNHCRLIGPMLLVVFLYPHRYVGDICYKCGG